ncbi:MAG: hypothetical protein FWC39_00385 [Bacteroidetes bacterium]|nr:hypothetical protein [Bacteroidota bacterium]
MKKVLVILTAVIGFALIATTMTSCNKEKDINLKDNTENTFTMKVTDYRTGDVIVGAVVKDSQGNTVATTAADGTATYTKKAGDNLLFTVEANGYAAMMAGNSVAMCKLDAKFLGVATYSDKSGNLSVVPSGTELSIQIGGEKFVKQVYKTRVVDDEGKFEFTSLPNGAYFYFMSPTSIGNNTYSAESYYSGFEAGTTTSRGIHYSYINNELPLAVVSRPGTVTATGKIVFKFNKEVDTEYESNYVYAGYETNFTKEWSSDKKMLTLTPTTNWGSVGNTRSIEYRFYTPAVDGVRQSVGSYYYINIVE